MRFIVTTPVLPPAEARRATALFAMDGLPDTTGLDGVVSCTPTTVALEKAYDAAKYGETSERPRFVKSG